jgi:hypothetical protein
MGRAGPPHLGGAAFSNGSDGNPIRDLRPTFAREVSALDATVPTFKPALDDAHSDA